VAEPGVDDLEQRIDRLEQTDQRLAQALELLARRDAAPVKRGRDWDAYAAVIATFIGLLALAVSGYTAHVQRQQLRAQVWPHLRIDFSTINPGYHVINQGTGPARVTAARVTIGGVPVRSWDALWAIVGFVGDEGIIRSSIDRSVLLPGKELTVVQPKDDDVSRRKFFALLPHGAYPVTYPVVMTICYCSVLDECWVAESGSRLPDDEPIDHCPIAAIQRFAD